MIAGAVDGQYAAKVLRKIARSPFAGDIQVLGKVSKERKMELLQTCHLLLVTSLKEGWGLVVTEAASQGTPAVVYNADGLRDSVKNQETGLITKENTPQALADSVNELIKNKDKYKKFRQSAWQWSHEITFDTSYRQFKEILNNA